MKRILIFPGFCLAEKIQMSPGNRGSRNKEYKPLSVLDLDVDTQGQGPEQKIAKSSVTLVFRLLLCFRTVFKPKFFTVF